LFFIKYIICFTFITRFKCSDKIVFVISTLKFSIRRTRYFKFHLYLVSPMCEVKGGFRKVSSPFFLYAKFILFIRLLILRCIFIVYFIVICCIFIFIVLAWILFFTVCITVNFFVFVMFLIIVISCCCF